MNSILSDLYHGELRPNERSYPADSDVGVLLESFRQNVKWLSELLDGKAKEHLLELINIHDELVGTMTYSSMSIPFSPLRILSTSSAQYCIDSPMNSSVISLVKKRISSSSTGRKYLSKSFISLEVSNKLI